MLIQKNLHDAMAMIPKDAYAEYANGVVDGTPGQTYLHMASYGGRPNNVENWFHWGAGINKLDDTGHNALHYAADQDQLECVEVLLRYGCRSNVKDHQGKLPADLARGKAMTPSLPLLKPQRQGRRRESEEWPASPWLRDVCRGL
ncbi:hypothetical protein J3458_019588 [Metarhizium acridum]|uniref:uncharacterized protein n=1 Tax=Metarhizium acridum TaxID=92637 RepID=UPI001C6B6813|nr:hypothetical protein J3458_019588 [Metarhizium acridum]